MLTVCFFIDVLMILQSYNDHSYTISMLKSLETTYKISNITMTKGDNKIFNENYLKTEYTYINIK